MTKKTHALRIEAVEKSSKRWIAFGLLASLSLSTAPALAYIPPSSYILKNLVAKHAGLAGIQVTSFVTGFESGKPGANRFKSTVFYNAATGSLIGTAFDATTGQKLYQVERKPGSLSAPATLMLATNAKMLEQTLSNAGVALEEPAPLPSFGSPPEPTAPNALARFKSQVAWVIGTGSEKLWVEKDSFLPIRLLGAKGSEVRFESYRFYKEFPYPRMITAYSGPETPVFQDEASEIQVFSDASKMKAPKLAGAAGFTPDGDSVSSSLQELIQQYYEALR